LAPEARLLAPEERLLAPEDGQLATEDVGKKLRLPDRSRHPVKDDPHFADALRRRLEPAWLAAVKSWRLAGLCDAALDMTVDRVRVVQAKKKLLLLGFLLLLRGLCLLRFLRHVALQAMSKLAVSNDERLNVEHRTPITTATRKGIRIELERIRRGPGSRATLLEC
jgi:hypothetical protein